MKTFFSSKSGCGALVFDIDQTLLPPDESLDKYPAIRKKIVELLQAGMCVAFISGGPGAVAKHRVLDPLLRKGRTKVNRLHFYVNGGGSKFRVTKKGELIEDLAFAKKNKIKGAHVLAIKHLLEKYAQKKFGMNPKMIGEWRQKRDAQWRGRKIQFDDGWMENKKWQIAFWEDTDMAAVKAGKRSSRTSFPFINTRRTKRNAKGQIQSVAGLTPSGFYTRREKIIANLKRDLGKITDQLMMREAGRSSIDITRAGADKAACLKDLIETEKLEPRFVSYFGDEFHAGGNDEPIVSDDELQNSELNIYALNPQKPPCSARAYWLGKNPAALHTFLLALSFRAASEKS